MGGGQFNWERHVNGKAHLKRLEKANLPPPNPKQQITSFFAPKFTQQSAVLETPPPPLPHNSPPIHATASSQRLPEIIAIDDNTPINTPPHPLLRRLQAAAASLPDSIPLGVESEDLDNMFHSFGFPPNIVVEDGADAWEDFVNPTFHAFQGRSPAQIAEELRRGQFGVDGLCHWVETSFGPLKVHPDLLKDRVERIIQAMVLWYVLL